MSTTSDEPHALEQRVRDGVERRVDELGAIEVRDDLHVGRAGRRGSAPSTFSWTPSSTTDGFTPRSRRTMPETTSGSSSLPTMPLRCERAELQRPEVLQEDRRALVLRDDDVAEIVEAAHEADAADDGRLIAAHEDAAAGVRVVRLRPPSTTCSSETLYWASFAGSSASWNCVVSPPKFVTSATPKTCFSVGMTTHCCSSFSSRESRDARRERVAEDLADRRRERIEIGLAPRGAVTACDALADARAAPSSRRRRRGRRA